MANNRHILRTMLIVGLTLPAGRSWFVWLGSYGRDRHLLTVRGYRLSLSDGEIYHIDGQTGQFWSAPIWPAAPILTAIAVWACVRGPGRLWLRHPRAFLAAVLRTGVVWSIGLLVFAPFVVLMVYGSAVFAVVVVLALLAWATVGLAVGINTWNRRLAEELGVCLICSYDLTGNESGICPECGTPTESAETPE